jgi:hypothetical protein
MSQGAPSAQPLRSCTRWSIVETMARERATAPTPHSLDWQQVRRLGTTKHPTAGHARLRDSARVVVVSGIVAWVLFEIGRVRMAVGVALLGVAITTVSLVSARGSSVVGRARAWFAKTVGRALGIAVLGTCYLLVFVGASVRPRRARTPFRQRSVDVLGARCPPAYGQSAVHASLRVRASGEFHANRYTSNVSRARICNPGRLARH